MAEQPPRLEPKLRFTRFAGRLRARRVCVSSQRLWGHGGGMLTAHAGHTCRPAQVVETAAQRVAVKAKDARARNLALNPTLCAAFSTSWASLHVWPACQHGARLQQSWWQTLPTSLNCLKPLSSLHTNW